MTYQLQTSTTIPCTDDFNTLEVAVLVCIDPSDSGTYISAEQAVVISDLAASGDRRNNPMQGVGCAVIDKLDIPALITCLQEVIS